MIFVLYSTNFTLFYQSPYKPKGSFACFDPPPHFIIFFFLSSIKVCFTNRRSARVLLELANCIIRMSKPSREVWYKQGKKKRQFISSQALCTHIQCRSVCVCVCVCVFSHSYSQFHLVSHIGLCTCLSTFNVGMHS